MTNALKAKALLLGLGCESCMSKYRCKHQENMYCEEYEKIIDHWHMAPPVDRIFYQQPVYVKGDENEDKGTGTSSS